MDFNCSTIVNKVMLQGKKVVLNLLLMPVVKDKNRKHRMEKQRPGQPWNDTSLHCFKMNWNEWGNFNSALGKANDCNRDFTEIDGSFYEEYR